MKILLTGEPKSGKSTVLVEFLKFYKDPKFGVLAREFKNNGKREGFEAVSIVSGESRIFALKCEGEPFAPRVGNYIINVPVIEDFVVSQLTEGFESDALAIVDEIGPMQMGSKKFLNTMENLFNKNMNFLGTIALKDYPWSIAFKNHPLVILININDWNRNLLPSTLVFVFRNLKRYKLLEKHNNLVFQMLKNYLGGPRLRALQVVKLFKNAVPRFLNNQVKLLHTVNDESLYSIKGESCYHVVLFKHLSGSYECDCDIFHGRNKYKMLKGECSHIQAVKLLQV